MTDEMALDSADDVNTVDDLDGREDDDAGNRVSGGTPLAVVTYLVSSIASDPESVVINTEEHGELGPVSRPRGPRRHGPRDRPARTGGPGHPHRGGRGRCP